MYVLVGKQLEWAQLVGVNGFDMNLGQRIF